MTGKAGVLQSKESQKVGYYLVTEEQPFPDQGSNPCPLHWKHGILTAGLPGKSLYIQFQICIYFFIYYFYFCYLALKSILLEVYVNIF